MNKQDNGRYQTQQQLRKIKDSEINRWCSNKGDLFYVHVWLVIVVICAATAWMWNFSFGLGILIKDADNRGSFGDVFGVVNSAFSGLAFIGVVYSVLIQRKELDTVREERDETRQIFKDQQHNLKQQRFETTFFHLFEYLNGIADDFEVNINVENSSQYLSDTTKVIKGRAAFELIVKEITDEFKKLADDRRKIQEKFEEETSRIDGDTFDGFIKIIGLSENLPSHHSDKDLYRIAYQKSYSAYGDDIGRYFRSLYTILNFIETTLESSTEDSEQEKEDKKEQRKFYFKLLRSQLSRHEATLILFNYVSDNTTDKFNALIKKYGMAKNADLSNYIVGNSNLYIDMEIFGKSFVDAYNDNVDEQAERASEQYTFDPADRPDKHND